MSMKNILIAMLFAVCTLNFNSQVTFIKAYGGSQDEINECADKTIGGLCATTGNGYALFHSTYSYGFNQYTNAAYFLKLNQFGDTLFTRSYYDSTQHCIGRSVKQNPDGGYILGVYFARGQGLVRTDANGNILWSKAFYKPSNMYGNPVAYYGSSLSDNSFLSTGYIQVGNFMGSLCKVDAQGNSIFGKRYHLSNLNSYNVSTFFSSHEIQDGGILSAGYFYGSAPNPNTSQAYLVKTDKMGNVKWAKIYGDANSSLVHSAVELSDKSICMVGYWNNINNQSDNKTLLIKVDSLGNMIYSKLISSGIGKVGCSITRDMQDNIYFVSYDGNESAVFKMTSGGNVTWNNVYGDCDIGNCIMQTADGGLAIQGFTDKFGSGASDVFLIKTDGSGNAGCGTSAGSYTISNISFNTITLSIAADNDLVAINVPLQVKHGGNTTTLCQNLATSAPAASADKSKIAIFPNPAIDKIRFETDYSITQIKIFNSMGQLVRNENNHQSTMDISDLPSGIYSVEIKTDIGSKLLRVIKE
jgi:hypothetical protein